VYFPLKLTQASGRPAGNNKKNGLIYPLIDPRLEYELALALHYEPDIMIISFEQLVNMLSQEDTLSFRQLAESVQEINRQRAERQPAAPAATEPMELVAEAYSPDSESAPDEEPISSEPEVSLTAPDDTNPITEAPETVTDTFEGLGFTYSSTALADATYTIPESIIGDIIHGLKSHTWGTQSSAIGGITTRLLNEASPDELFVLGRNILQTAIGSSFDAERFLVRFRQYTAKKTSMDASRHLVNGMLYEVYFDSHNAFRGSLGKAYLLPELANIIEANPHLVPCAEFIEKQLESYGDLVLFIPHVRQGQHTLTLSFNATYATDPSDITALLDSCSIDGEVITNIIDEEQEIDSLYPQRNISHYAYDLQRMMQITSLSRYIPFTDDYIQVSYELDGILISSDDLGDYEVPPGLIV
jgi:hypothetical protein